MGLFNFFHNVGKSFQHAGQVLKKGLSDPYKLGKDAAHAVSRVTKPAQQGLSVVNKTIRTLQGVPIVGQVLNDADAAVFAETGISPILGLRSAEIGLDAFNKLEGRLAQANSAEEFVRQNKDEIKKLLQKPELRQKVLDLLRRLT